MEIEGKLTVVRAALAAADLAAVRFRGIDWFAWLTGGGSNAVLLAAETGPAEVLVTSRDAWVLTDTIEHARLTGEEVPRGLEVWSRPWETPEQTEDFVRDHAKGGAVASDRPITSERALPAAVVAARRRLGREERDRYRRLGRDAAEAMTEALTAARPDWTEQRLAGEAARALWTRGIHPALTLVAGEARVARYRHAVATAARLDGVAMLVCCGRRHGLYANLTRFVSFRTPTLEERRGEQAAKVAESTAFGQSRPGIQLAAVYQALVESYARVGFPGECARHHQGGITGYLAREAIATPTATTPIELGTALAWNPSVPGAKIEDTVLCTEAGIEILSVDPSWPVSFHDGRPRPDRLVRP